MATTLPFSARLDLLRVLLVDDYPDSAASMMYLLRRQFGCTVKMCVNGRDCEKTALEFRPHVMFLDLGMPGRDGFEVAQSLRKRPEFNDLVLVALTGLGTKEVRQRTVEVGFNYYLLKPAALREIVPILCLCARSLEEAEKADLPLRPDTTHPWTEFV